MTDINGFTYSDGRIEFTIHEHLGVIDENKDNGWKREVNIVSWNGGSPRIDIRHWNPEHTKMSRGITLQRDEGRKLADILREYYASRENRQRCTVKRDDYER